MVNPGLFIYFFESRFNIYVLSILLRCMGSGGGEPGEVMMWGVLLFLVASLSEYSEIT